MPFLLKKNINKKNDREADMLIDIFREKKYLEIFKLIYDSLTMYRRGF